MFWLDFKIYNMFRRTIVQFNLLKIQNVTIPLQRTVQTKGSRCNPEVKKTGPPVVPVVMMRHGQSVWNEKNLFSGWYDCPLTYEGFLEAKAAARTLKLEQYTFDVAFTSMLTRAHQTLQEILLQLKLRKIPTIKSWRLNERHYGALTGLNKAETAAKYGEEQVQKWRRSFSIRPPQMKDDHMYFEKITKDQRYAGVLEKCDFPTSESLKNTIERTLPFWNEAIAPRIKAQKKVLIVAHGNSLRGIVKMLDNMSDNAIMEVNLPTGIPFVYYLDPNTMKPTKPYKFLGDKDKIEKALETVTKQGRAEA